MAANIFVDQQHLNLNFPIDPKPIKVDSLWSLLPENLREKVGARIEEVFNQEEELKESEKQNGTVSTFEQQSTPIKVGLSKK